MNRPSLLPLGLSAALAATAQVHAAEPHAVVDDAPLAQEEAVASRSAQPPEDTASNAPPLPLAELDRNRAGETLVLGNQSLEAVATGNVINGNYAAGAITFSENALSNFNGVGNFAINTGAQVTLQSGLNLTINLGP